MERERRGKKAEREKEKEREGEREKEKEGEKERESPSCIYQVSLPCLFFILHPLFCTPKLCDDNFCENLQLHQHNKNARKT